MHLFAQTEKALIRRPEPLTIFGSKVLELLLKKTGFFRFDPFRDRLRVAIFGYKPPPKTGIVKAPI